MSASECVYLCECVCIRIIYIIYNIYIYIYICIYIYKYIFIIYLHHVSFFVFIILDNIKKLQSCNISSSHNKNGYSRHDFEPFNLYLGRCS